jgi:drug/metabolite transporter (DMT)-like permease
MSPPLHRDHGGILYVALALIGWASVPLFLRYLTGHIDGWTANGWRYGLSALFWLPVLIVGVRRGVVTGALWRAAIVPALFNSAGQVCFAWAPYYIDPGLMAFVLRFQIIFSTVAVYLVFQSERPVLRSTSYRVGLLVVLFGSVGTILLGSGPRGGATAFGVILTIASAAFYGGYGVSVRRNLTGVHPIYAFAVICLYVATALVILMLALGDRSGAGVLSLSMEPLVAIVGSALVGIALGHVFYYASLARLGVAITDGVILMMPFLTAVASFFYFDERLNLGQWFCGIAAVVGSLAVLGARRHLVRPSILPREEDWYAGDIDPKIRRVIETTPVSQSEEP